MGYWEDIAHYTALALTQDFTSSIQYLKIHIHIYKLFKKQMINQIFYLDSFIFHNILLGYLM